MSLAASDRSPASCTCKSKSSDTLSVRSTLHGLLDPRIHKTVDLKTSNESFVLIHVIVEAYFSDCFRESFFANRFMNLWHSSPIPPFVPITRGVNDPCSTSRILWLYVLFFSSSCCLKMISVVWSLWLRASTCVTRISKKVSCPCRQKLRARISSLASGDVLQVLCLNVSPSRSVRNYVL